MKKIALAAAFSLAATSLMAGGMDDAEMEGKMGDPMMSPVIEEPSGDDNSLPLLILLAVVVAAVLR